MTRRILALAGLAAALVLATTPAAQAAPNPSLVITQTPAQVRLIPGETVDITLSTNVTTGYQWTAKAAGKKGTIKVSQGTYTAPANTEGMVGVPGTTTWTVTALKKGTGVVKIVATPPGGGAGTTSTVTVIVSTC